jgi:UDP-N-acetylmuramoyl-L-alanine---L-glutamate ligase
MSATLSALRDSRVGIWGIGRETIAFAGRLRRVASQGVAVAASDAPDPRAAELAERTASGDELLPALLTCDVVVRSPGVSIYRDEVRELEAAGIRVTTSTALWLDEPRAAPVIGVTGTKGKSTTASLIAHLLRAAGATVELAGNVGRPAIELLDVPAPELYVLELSSYQIADLRTGVDVAVVTSLFPEHLDWHGSTERYFADKLRLLSLAPLRLAVINGCDERLRDAATTARVVRYGCEGEFTLRGSAVVRRGDLIVGAEDLPLHGEHNLLNLAGALSAASAVDRLPADVTGALATFEALPHRLRSLGWREGVEWIDDSISTTPESTIAALRSFPERRPLVLIGGGFDREQDFASLGAELARRGVTVIALPANGERLVQAARAAGAIDGRLIEAEDLEAAIGLARRAAASGGVVLLSPAAPSFGQFASFEERGRRFAELAGFATV